MSMIFQVLCGTYAICLAATLVFYRLFHPWRLKKIGWSVLITPFAMLYSGLALGIPAAALSNIGVDEMAIQHVWDVYLVAIFLTPVIIHLLWSRSEGKTSPLPGSLERWADKIGKSILGAIFILIVFSLVADRASQVAGHNYHPVVEKIGIFVVLLATSLPLLGIAYIFFYDEPWLQRLLEDRVMFRRALFVLLGVVSVLGVGAIVLQTFLN